VATLRSPFLPASYGVFPAVWLVTLLAATYPPTRRVLVLVGLACLFLGVYWPIDAPIDPRWLAIMHLVPLAALVAVTVLALRRAGLRDPHGGIEGHPL